MFMKRHPQMLAWPASHSKWSIHPDGAHLERGCQRQANLVSMGRCGAALSLFRKIISNIIYKLHITKDKRFIGFN